MKGRPIEYAEPRKENTEENTMLSPRQSRLGALEGELNRPFDSVSPGHSLDGMIFNAPLPPPVMHAPRNNSNKRLDWMYRSTEDLLSADSVQEKYRRPELTADGRDLNKMRPMERAYYEALNPRSPVQPTNIAGFGGATVPGFNGLSEDSLTGLPSGLNSAVQSVLRNSRGYSPSGSTDATDFSEFNRNSGFPGRPGQAEFRRAQQFMEIYNPSAANSELPSATAVRTSPYVNSSFYDLAKPELPAPSAPGVSSLSSPQVNYAPVAPVQPVAPATPYVPPTPSARSSTPNSPFLNVTRSGIQ